MIAQRRLVVALSSAGLSLALLLGGAGPSRAAFPGRDGRIYFTRGQFFPGDTVSIFSVSKHGGKVHRLTKQRNPGEDGFVSVAPNGRTLAFDSDRVGGTPQIFKMNAFGKHQHAITHGSDSSFDPAFSPNGKRIAFAGLRKGKSGLFTMKANGKHVRRVTSIGPDAFSARWSLDGKHLAFQSDNDGDFDVYMIRTNGKHLKQLTDSPGFDGDPEFSPNGRKLLFDSSRTGSGDVYQMNLDGSHLKQITKNPASENGPAYSPSGRSIVYSRGDGLFVATRKGKHPHLLTTPPSGLSDFVPIWAPRP